MLLHQTTALLPFGRYMGNKPLPNARPLLKNPNNSHRNQTPTTIKTKQANQEKQIIVVYEHMVKNRFKGAHLSRSRRKKSVTVPVLMSAKVDKERLLLKFKSCRKIQKLVL